MKEYERTSFESPQQLADYFAKRDATNGMILSKLKEHFNLTNEEAEWFLSKAQFKGAVRARGKGLQELIIGSLIIVAVCLIAFLVTSTMLKAGFAPGLPLVVIAGAGMLFGVIMAFNGLMKLFSGSEVE